MAEFFDRQVRIENWDQEKLSKSVALCLGVGGLGSYVTIHLARLGVKKLILIDYDVVDVHNLNRQILYSVSDIGRPKVEAAKDSLARHNLVSEIEVYDFDIILNWSRVVAIAQEATVVFNMIDYGDYFDLAAQSLALHLKIPLISGGTFSSCLTIDLLRPEGRPCLLCLNDGLDRNIIAQLKPDLISSYESLSFLPKNDNPVGQSNAYLCGTCGILMIAQFSNFLIADPEITVHNRVIFYVSTMESVCFPSDINPRCEFCGDPNYISPEDTKRPEETKNLEETPALPTLPETLDLPSPETPAVERTVEPGETPESASITKTI